MKKLLALVLALVMTLGLATVAANASYPDAKSIDLEEAVDVMSAVGVFQGDEKGNFNAKGNLDRAAAAKLIAYLALGEKAAEALPAVQMFSDVPASSWASKYIAYCANAGYVAGVGGGKYNPAGELTGYAFGKMVLCVLGYDAAVEGFTGTGWEINVAKLMQDANITDGVDASASAVLTREQAAQYCFNALKADMVEYESKGTSVKINGAEIATGASKAEAKTVTNAPKYNSIDDTKTSDTTPKAIVQLGEKLYEGKLTLTKGEDSFGVDSLTWKFDGKKVGSYATEEPILTYTTSVKEKALFTDIGVDGISGTSAKFIVLDEIWVDGVQVAKSEKKSDTWFVADTTLTSRDGAYDETVVIAKADSSNMAGPGNGVTTTIYAAKDSNGDIIANHYKMVCVKEYLTSITSITKANDTTGAGRKVNTGMGSYETEEFAKSDKVLVTIANGSIKSMIPAVKVEDVAVTSYTNSSVTADGTTYKYSQQVGTVEDKDNFKMSSGNSYTFYLDSCGYILAGEKYSAASTDYYYVTGVGTPSSDDFSSDYSVKYQLVGMDGKVVVVKQMESDGTADVDANKIVTYEADSDNADCVKITVVADYNSSNSGTAGYLVSTNALTSFSKTTATKEGVTFNNSTVFVIKTGSSTYKVVEGLSAMDNWTNLNTKVYTVTKSDVAKVAFMDCYNSGSAATSSSTDELIYVIDTDMTTGYDSAAKKTIYTYKTVDGEVTATSALFNAEGLWKVTNTESGHIKAATPVTETGKYVFANLTSEAKAVKYDSGVLTIAGKAYVVASDVAVTLIDNDNNVTEDADVEALVGDAVKGFFQMIQVSDTDKTIQTIYFNGTVE